MDSNTQKTLTLNKALKELLAGKKYFPPRSINTFVPSSPSKRQYSVDVDIISKIRSVLALNDVSDSILIENLLSGTYNFPGIELDAQNLALKVQSMESQIATLLHQINDLNTQIKGLSQKLRKPIAEMTPRHQRDVLKSWIELSETQGYSIDDMVMLYLDSERGQTLAKKLEEGLTVTPFTSEETARIMIESDLSRDQLDTIRKCIGNIRPSLAKTFKCGKVACEKKLEHIDALAKSLGRGFSSLHVELDTFKAIEWFIQKLKLSNPIQLRVSIDGRKITKQCSEVSMCIMSMDPR
jgi:hypothetical protein